MTTFEEGEFVKIKLTGDIGMVIDTYEDVDLSHLNYLPGYQVRTPDYKVHKFYHFELTKRFGDDGSEET